MASESLGMPSSRAALRSTNRGRRNHRRGFRGAMTEQESLPDDLDVDQTPTPDPDAILLQWCYPPRQLAESENGKAFYYKRANALATRAVDRSRSGSASSSSASSSYASVRDALSGKRHRKPRRWTTKQVANAARFGDLQALLRVDEEGGTLTMNAFACATAALGGHIDFVEYIREEHGCPWDEKTCEGAAEGGHMDVLKYAHEQGGCAMLGNSHVCRKAAKIGQIDIVQYAREHGAPWDAKTTNDAAKGGHLDVIKYAYENGCAWDHWACHRAAEGGHLDVLEYLHSHGCPWNNITCERAAKGGHLDALRYAIERGCDWGIDALKGAASGGHVHVLKYLVARAECPSPGKWGEAHLCTLAAENGHADALAWLHARGCPWDEETCVRAAGGGHLGALQYARENGCPWNANACERAAGMKAHWTVKTWIVKNEKASKRNAEQH